MAEQEIEFIAELPTVAGNQGYIVGPIQNVLNRLSDLRVTARRVIYYSDDGYNAICIYRRNM